LSLTRVTALGRPAFSRDLHTQFTSMSLAPDPPDACALARSAQHRTILDYLRPTIVRHRLGHPAYELPRAGSFEKAHPFPTALDVLNMEEYESEFGFPPYTIFEIELMILLASVKEKPRWWEKIDDETIWAKWIKEMKEGTEKRFR